MKNNFVIVHNTNPALTFGIYDTYNAPFAYGSRAHFLHNKAYRKIDIWDVP